MNAPKGFMSGCMDYALLERNLSIIDVIGERMEVEEIEKDKTIQNNKEKQKMASE